MMAVNQEQFFQPSSKKHKLMLVKDEDIPTIVSICIVITSFFSCVEGYRFLSFLTCRLLFDNWWYAITWSHGFLYCLTPGVSFLLVLYCFPELYLPKREVSEAFTQEGWWKTMEWRIWRDMSLSFGSITLTQICYKLQVVFAVKKIVDGKLLMV